MSGAARWRGRMPIGRGHPLAKTLFRLCNQQQTTVTELAVRAGVGKHTIGDWKCDYTPSLENLEACLNVLGYELVVRKRPDEV